MAGLSCVCVTLCVCAIITKHLRHTTTVLVKHHDDPAEKEK
jgi:hypothetical protein